MSQPSRSQLEKSVFPYQYGDAIYGASDHTMYACPFPSPPPQSHYCTPAPFSQVNGQRYHYLGHAYGKSRPVVPPKQ